MPQGPGYENISIDNQVCATVGAVAGQDTVNGNVFIELAYGYSYSNTWMVSCTLNRCKKLLIKHFDGQNFGIILAFGIFFIIALLVFSEYNTALSTDTSVVLFKRGTEGATTRTKREIERRYEWHCTIDDKRKQTWPRQTRRDEAHIFLAKSQLFGASQGRYSETVGRRLRFRCSRKAHCPDG